jgi:hypothetical protein
MDLKTGVLRHLPEAGGILDQDDLLMTHIWAAWRTWVIDAKLPENHTEADAEFMRNWVFANRSIRLS